MNQFTKLASFASVLLVGALFSGAAMAQSVLTLTFADPVWDGVSVPAGQHCGLQGGAGATPALDVAGVPDATTAINVAFSDETYEPMNNGGHGTIGFVVAPVEGKVALPSVPGGTLDMPDGVMIAAENLTSGDFLTPGYMPPCSGGNGNLYSAKVTALDATGAELATGRIELGRY